MHPGLVDRKRLRIGHLSLDRGRMPILGALLVAGLIYLVIAGAVLKTPVQPVQTLHTIQVPLIQGTNVPAPAAPFAELASKTAGRHVFSARKVSAAAATQLFDYYVRSMAAEGWTLAAKSVPGPQGEWTLKWNFGQQSALLSLYTTPKVRLIVDDCPPEPYC